LCLLFPAKGKSRPRLERTTHLLELSNPLPKLQIIIKKFRLSNAKHSINGICIKKLFCQQQSSLFNHFLLINQFICHYLKDIDTAIPVRDIHFKMLDVDLLQIYHSTQMVVNSNLLHILFRRDV